MKAAVRAHLGDPKLLEAPAGYPDGLALCIVDSVQSLGVKYASVINVLDKYRGYRRAQGADPYTDGADDLLATFADIGSSKLWAKKIGNGNLTSSRGNSILKAEAIKRCAGVMVDHDILTTAQLRQAKKDDGLAAVKKAWVGIPGQRPGTSWYYVQMLAGIDETKPDRMITRFVSRGLGVAVLPNQARELVTETAVAFGITVFALDHNIWKYQRKQPLRQR
jgi:hypothetical protein